MAPELDSIKKALIRIKEIFEEVIVLASIAKKNLRLTVTIIVIMLSYGGLYWFSYYYPSRTIDTFYKLIEDGHPEKAWPLISLKYREHWVGGEKQFCDGFRTTVVYSDIKVSFSGSILKPFNIISNLISPTVEYDVSFTINDLITKEDCKKQYYISLWCQLKDPDHIEYNSLMAANIPTMKITRYQKKKFKLHRLSILEWQISDIETFEEGIRHSYN